jgi:1,2-phenylacetyl-CoA epoxidase PaaB subunit
MNNEHTILVHAEGAWSHDVHLDDLLKALDARRELVEPAVGYTVRRRVAAVSLWVEADSEVAAWEMANRALVEEMGQLGLA